MYSELYWYETIYDLEAGGGYYFYKSYNTTRYSGNTQARDTGSWEFNGDPFPSEAFAEMPPRTFWGAFPITETQTTKEVRSSSTNLPYPWNAPTIAIVTNGTTSSARRTDWTNTIQIISTVNTTTTAYNTTAEKPYSTFAPDGSVHDGTTTIFRTDLKPTTTQKVGIYEPWFGSIPIGDEVESSTRQIYDYYKQGGPGYITTTDTWYKNHVFVWNAARHTNQYWTATDLWQVGEWISKYIIGYTVWYADTENGEYFIANDNTYNDVVHNCYTTDQYTLYPYVETYDIPVFDVMDYSNGSSLATTTIPIMGVTYLSTTAVVTEWYNNRYYIPWWWYRQSVTYTIQTQISYSIQNYTTAIVIYTNRNFFIPYDLNTIRASNIGNTDTGTAENQSNSASSEYIIVSECLITFNTEREWDEQTYNSYTANGYWDYTRKGIYTTVNQSTRNLPGIDMSSMGFAAYAQTIPFSAVAGPVGGTWNQYSNFSADMALYMTAEGAKFPIPWGYGVQVKPAVYVPAVSLTRYTDTLQEITYSYLWWGYRYIYWGDITYSITVERPNRGSEFYSTWAWEENSTVITNSGYIVMHKVDPVPLGVGWVKPVQNSGFLGSVDTPTPFWGHRFPNQKITQVFGPGGYVYYTYDSGGGTISETAMLEYSDVYTVEIEASAGGESYAISKVPVVPAMSFIVSNESKYDEARYSLA